MSRPAKSRPAPSRRRNRARPSSSFGKRSRKAPGESPALRPPLLVLLPESPDRAVGRRHRVRISRCSRRSIRTNFAELKARWPFGKFPLLVDDGGTVIETTWIIDHLQAHHPGPNGWIPDGDLGLRVRFLDRFFDIYVMDNMQAGRERRPPARKARAIPMARSRGATTCTSLTTGSRPTRRRPWAAGEQFTLADCAAAPSLFYADWVEEIGDRTAEAGGLSRAAARSSGGRPCGRRGTALSALFPARRARPRLSEGDGTPQQLVGLDHRREAGLVASDRRRSCRGDSGGPASNRSGAASGGRRRRRDRALTAPAARSC